MLNLHWQICMLWRYFSLLNWPNIGNIMSHLVTLIVFYIRRAFIWLATEMGRRSVQRTLTVGGSITAWLFCSSTSLDLTMKENMWLLGCSETVVSKLAKLETSRTVIHYRETTAYSDRPTTHYHPISDAFVDKKYFFLHYTSESTLTLLRNSLFNVNKQTIFQCHKNKLKWGGMR